MNAGGRVFESVHGQIRIRPSERVKYVLALCMPKDFKDWGHETVFLKAELFNQTLSRLAWQEYIDMF